MVSLLGHFVKPNLGAPRGVDSPLPSFYHLSASLMPDQPEPFDDPLQRIIPMDTPEYDASLTDPMAEVDAHFKALRDICQRYGLAFFLMVTHPAGDGAVKHQFRCDVIPPAKASSLYGGLNLQLRSLSRGRIGLCFLNPEDPLS